MIGVAIFRDYSDGGFQPGIGRAYLKTPPVEPESFTSFRKQLAIYLSNWGEIWKGYSHIDKLREFAGHLSTTDAEETKLQAFLTYETLRLHLFRPGALRFPAGYNTGPIADVKVGGNALSAGSSSVPATSSDASETTLGLCSTEALYSGEVIKLLGSLASVIEHIYDRKDVIAHAMRATERGPRFHLPDLDLPVHKIRTFGDVELTLPNFRRGITERIEYSVSVRAEDGTIRKINNAGSDLLLACCDAFVEPDFVGQPILKVEYTRAVPGELGVSILIDSKVGEALMERFALTYLSVD